MKKLYTDKNLSIQIMILVCLQPLIDIYRLFVDNAIQIAGISLVELFNFASVGYLAVLFVLNKPKLKRLLPLAVYAVVIGLYIVLHCLNINQFNADLLQGASINFVVEIYAMLRAYILPIILLYMMVCIKTEKERFLKTTVYVSWFISGLIFITNIFKVSYVCYASYLKENQFISHNIFSWFTGEQFKNPDLLTSKGWFYSGNQIGLILLMLFPIVVYYALHSKKVVSYVFVFIQMIAMLMVSTKTAALGAFFILGAIMALLVFFGLRDKCFKKNLKQLAVFGLILVVGLGVLKYAPLLQRRSVASQEMENTYNKDEDDEDDEKDDEEEVETQAIDIIAEMSDEEFTKYLNGTRGYYGIHPEYLKLYPAEYHREFWFNLIKNFSGTQSNFRDLKESIYYSVLEENDNKADKFLGIGYTSNFPYLEKDVKSQNVWYGWIGTILLLGPYLAVFVYSAILILKKMKKRFTMYNCALGISILMAFMASLIAGHLFGYFFPVTMFGFVLSALLQSVKYDSEDEEKDMEQVK